MMPDHEEFKVDTGNQRYQVTIYSDGMKIVGQACWSLDARLSSRRASDFLNSLPPDRITLAKPRVYERVSGLVVDEPEFIVVNMIAAAASGSRAPKDAETRAAQRAERYYKV